MSRNCICYITDDGYLFPTLTSALQARRNVGGDTDVVICHVDARLAKADVVAAICARHQIKFVHAAHSAIDGLHIMYARLFLDRLLPADYDHVLYIDGDTQIAAKLDGLIDIAAPDGAFLAAPDPMVLALNRDSADWRERRAYFASLGLESKRLARYFNSGVMRFTLASIPEIRKECMSSPQFGGKALRFPDQDLLNICCHERCLPMSFKWNFPIFFLNCGLRSTIQPSVYHFMSNPRPWHGAFRPWGKEFSAIYGFMLATYPELTPLVEQRRAWKQGKYWLQQHYKAAFETLTWNRPEVHAQVRAMEAAALI